MVDKYIIQKNLYDVIDKCSKNKSSSNVNTSFPFDDITDIDLDDFKDASNKDMENQIKSQEDNTNLSDNEFEALHGYFGNDFQWINGLIYDDKQFLKEYGGGTLEKMWREKLGSVIHDMDSSISKSVPLKENTTLHRIGKFDKNLGIGETGVWEGYTSTSYSSQGTSSIGGGDWDITILAMKGVKGINANAHTTLTNGSNHQLTSHPNEKELLLGRKTKYTVLSKNLQNKECVVLVF